MKKEKTGCAELAMLLVRTLKFTLKLKIYVDYIPLNLRFLQIFIETLMKMCEIQ